MNTQLAETFTHILDDLEAMLKEIAEFYAGQSLGDIQSEYRDTLYAAMKDYLESEGSVVRYRNEVRRAVNNAFTLAFVAGWAESGASGELPRDEQDWINARIEQEITYVDSLFWQLKELRDNSDLSADDKLQRIGGTADGYTASVPGVYAQGRIMAAPHMDLTLDGDDGQESCEDCQRLKREWHPAQWWVDNDYVPRPGNSFECKGYRCMHYLKDRDGNIWSGMDAGA